VTITGADGAAVAFEATCAAGVVSADAAPSNPIDPTTAAAPTANPPILPNDIYDQLPAVARETPDIQAWQRCQQVHTKNDKAT
jgi:hypothetical protein